MTSGATGADSSFAFALAAEETGPAVAGGLPAVAVCADALLLIPEAPIKRIQVPQSRAWKDQPYVSGQRSEGRIHTWPRPGRDSEHTLSEVSKCRKYLDQGTDGREGRTALIGWAG